MADFPYLGNRISLISSSQIRYEGILYTIDTLHGTVTLAQVRSYGTEDRPTERPVAERDEVYDFIVFRGSDIKDIKLCNVRKPYDDPAIVEMGTMTSSGGAPGAPLPTASGASTTLSAGGAAAAAFGSSSTAGQLHQHASDATSVFSLSEPLSAASRLSSAVAPGAPLSSAAHRVPVCDPLLESSTSPSRKSPTTDQGVQAGGPHGTNSYHYQQQQQDRGARYNDRQYVGGGGFRGQRGGPGGGGPGGRRGGGRGAPVGGAAGRGSFAPARGQPLKFDEDFDFEEANKQFAELAASLAKTKISVDESGNGDGVEATTSADENGAADGSSGSASVKADEREVCYDKTKSFFDTISCDAVQRATRDVSERRQDWQLLRRQNMETFGVEGTQQRGFRRGGGYYNNNGNRGGGGGYYGNNRGGGGGGGYYGYNRGGGGGYYGNNRGGGGGGYYGNNRGGGGYYNNGSRGGYGYGARNDGDYNSYSRGYNNRGFGGGYRRGGRGGMDNATGNQSMRVSARGDSTSHVQAVES